jgi:glycosyltransferase involved in cell wall biosynthesis
MVEGSDATIVVSEAERDLLARLQPEAKIHVIPTIHEAVTSIRPFQERKGLLFVGSFSHPPNEDAIVYFSEVVFPLVRRQLPDISLTVVGHSPSPKVASLASDRIKVTGWVPDLDPHFQYARLFVAPMRFGAGISGKVVQSLSYGLPVVTTSIGAEGLALTGSLKTMVADHSKELAGRIVDLYRNEPLWNELSRDAIAFVESNYSSAVARDRLQRLLEEQIDSIRRTVGREVLS